MSSKVSVKAFIRSGGTASINDAPLTNDVTFILDVEEGEKVLLEGRAYQALKLLLMPSDWRTLLSGQEITLAE